MTATALSLPVILPEVILAAGVLVLLLVGAFRGEKSAWLVSSPSFCWGSPSWCWSSASGRRA